MSLTPEGTSKQFLATDIFGVQPASDGFIVSPLNNRPGIGEKGDFVFRRYLEAEEEIVGRGNRRYGGQLLGNLLE
jgi:hypothetical protein